MRPDGLAKCVASWPIASRAVLAAGLLALAVGSLAMGQDAAVPASEAKGGAPAAQAARLAEAGQKANAALAAKEPSAEEPSESDLSDPLAGIPPMNLWTLTVAGGPLMIPIGMFSVLVVALGIDRAVALRRRAILPRKLIAGLKALSHREHGLDPREAARVCRAHPSAAANVIRAMLSKAGKSRAQMERAAAESAQREADRLGGGVRWLSLSAAVAPMLGLLGTVQGMIQAFYITSHLPVVANRAVYLAESIYIALVTTFGGLTVAIPAAILAHLFSGRIQRLFRELDDAVPALAGQLERHARRQPASGGPPAPPRAEPPPPPGEARGKHAAPTRK
jgi:biopolymer transport protein ExbB